MKSHAKPRRHKEIKTGKEQKTSLLSFPLGDLVTLREPIDSIEDQFAQASIICLAIIPKDQMNKSPKPAIFEFEHRTQPLLHWPAFLKRLALSLLIGVAIILLSLFGGMAGYHYFEKLPWIDAFANAAMILSGMGPLAQPATIGGKIFAGIYALYSGLAVVMIAGITFAPIVHRFLHKLHADPED